MTLFALVFGKGSALGVEQKDKTKVVYDDRMKKTKIFEEKKIIFLVNSYRSQEIFLVHLLYRLNINGKPKPKPK